MMAIPPGWDIGKEGELTVGYVLGWETAHGGLAGLLRIRIAQNPRQVAKGGIALQIVLPPEQMRQLAADLNRLADQAPQPDPGLAQ